MEHTVIITHPDGTAAGWQVKMLKWNGVDDRHPVRMPLVLRKAGDVFKGTLDLKDGIYSLVCDLNAGVELKVDLDPPSPLYQSDDPDWPVELSVPPLRHRDTFLVYFTVGG